MKVGRMSTITYKIIDGPRAELIWDHTKHSMNKDVKIPVIFMTDHKLATVGPVENGPWVTLSPTIIGVSHEDGSGVSLIIKGYIGGKSFTGHYNARSRRGIIEVKTD